jgi:xanthine dehydrogenase accessory factor
MNQNPVVVLSEAILNKQPVVLATVVEVKGASPAKVGAQIILLAVGSTAGTVGGGKLEAAILTDAQIALREGTPRLTHYRLTEEGSEAIGVLCGGEVRVFIHPYFPPPRLIIVGGGHIGRPLKVMGEAAGFDVNIVDVEAGRATVPELDAVTR